MNHDIYIIITITLCLISCELFILCNNRYHICDGGYTTSFTSTLSAPYLSPRHRSCPLSYHPPCQHNQPRYRAPRRAAYLGSGSLVALGGASLGCYRLQSILRLTVGHPHKSRLLKSQKSIESSPVSFCTAGSPHPWPPTPGPTTSLSSLSYSCTQVIHVSYLVQFS